MRPPSRLYAIADADVAARRGWTLAALATEFLEAGVRFLQLRAKAMSSSGFLATCERVVEAAGPLGALVIVNDRADIARLAGAGGVHVGQDDLSVAAVRRVVGPPAVVGLSTHSLGQIARALEQPIDYLAVGPVFGTGTKETGYEPVGLALVTAAAEQAGAIPVVAIGGITLERAPEVIAAGAAAVSVISDLLAEDTPSARVRTFLRALGERE
jgi:thiamine-phosphate pyrophosphorylase